MKFNLMIKFYNAIKALYNIIINNISIASQPSLVTFAHFSISCVSGFAGALEWSGSVVAVGVVVAVVGFIFTFIRVWWRVEYGVKHSQMRDEKG